MSISLTSARKRFDAIRAAWVKVQDRRERFGADMRVKYGQYDAPRAWQTRTEIKRLEAIVAANGKVSDRMCALLDEISPRAWRSGVPAHWLMSDLTFEDAVTRGALSVVPPCAFGMRPADMRAFAAQTFDVPDTDAAARELYERSEISGERLAWADLSAPVRGHWRKRARDLRLDAAAPEHVDCAYCVRLTPVAGHNRALRLRTLAHRLNCRARHLETDPSIPRVCAHCERPIAPFTWSRGPQCSCADPDPLVADETVRADFGRDESTVPIAAGDMVRERNAPRGCEPYTGKVLYVANDGWVGVDLGSRSISTRPGEVERVPAPAATPDPLDGYDVEAFVDGYCTAALWADCQPATRWPWVCPNCGRRDNNPGEACSKCGRDDPNGDYSDETGGREHLTVRDESRERIAAECRDFIASNRADLDAYGEARTIEGVPLDFHAPNYAGHDFYLTRVGHGTGFWDRGLGDLGDRLTAACKPFEDVSGGLSLIDCGDGTAELLNA